MMHSVREAEGKTVNTDKVEILPDQVTIMWLKFAYIYSHLSESFYRRSVFHDSPVAPKTHPLDHLYRPPALKGSKRKMRGLQV